MQHVACMRNVLINWSGGEEDMLRSECPSVFLEIAFPL
jgi:hypothetical protein